MVAYRARLVVGTCAIFTALVIPLPSQRNRGIPWTPVDDNANGVTTVEFDERPMIEVLAATTKLDDTTSWWSNHMPGWMANFYIVDDPKVDLTVPKNKIRESMVYLTYVINNYDDLPNDIIFMHASRFTWHNDDPDCDAVPAPRNYQLPHLQESGYVNLRCV